MTYIDMRLCSQCQPRRLADYHAMPFSTANEEHEAPTFADDQSRNPLHQVSLPSLEQPVDQDHAQLSICEACSIFVSVSVQATSSRLKGSQPKGSEHTTAFNIRAFNSEFVMKGVMMQTIAFQSTKSLHV